MNADTIYKRAALRFLILFLLLSGTFYEGTAQSYGLIFSSHEVVPEKRTSLDLTSGNPVCFTSKLDLSFELSFVPDYAVYFGYIFRLVNKDQNIDLIYDQKKRNFRLVFGETFTDINFEIDSTVLISDWTKLRFTIDATKGITCYCNNKVWHSRNLNLKSNCFKLLFGSTSEHNFISTDVPPMKIRNIGLIADDKNFGFWPLDESAGETAEDTISHIQAKIINAGWIKPQHSNWKNLVNLTIRGRPGVAFNPDAEDLNIISTDSFYSISAKNSKLTAVALSVPHSNLLAGNQCIFNTYNKKLYDFYIDQKAVAEYDFKNNRWDRNFEDAPLTEFWQANKFFSNDGSLFIIGGYGQLKYKNSVQKYGLATKRWDTLKPTGDFFAPRYLAGLGATVSGDSAYIIGGYGSKEGDQLLSPKYFYDLLRYNVKNSSFKKIYSLPEPDEQFVFANSIILDNDGNYYGLIFPKNRFNNSLQLIRGSLSMPVYSLVGNTFPYSFNDVRSFADLYYDKKSKLLIAVTLYTTNDNITEVKAYSIHFPPNQLSVPGDNLKGITTKRSSGSLFITILVSGLLILCIFYLVYKNSRKRRGALLSRDNSAPTTAIIGLSKAEHQDNGTATEAGKFPETEQPAIIVGENIQSESSIHPGENILLPEDITVPVNKSRVILFGNFEVIMADGHNITRQFTPLLKELFLLILIDSLRYNKGVSSEKLNDILWNDKEIKDAKNNRSVNLVKLKNILDKLGGCTISRETGAWKFEYDVSLVYIDFLVYLNLFNHKEAIKSTLQVAELLEVLKAGSFLQETHYEWLDSIKAEISNFVIELLLKYSESININTETEKMISVCNAIFSFDELNEPALKLKCKSLIALGNHALAKNTFTKFKVKYQEIYGEEYVDNYYSLITQ